MHVRSFSMCALLGGWLGACTDGRLDVFQPSLDSGASGAGGFAGQPTGGSGGGAPASPFVLDDFEDGDTQSFIRDGFWYLKPDDTCTGSFGIELVTDRPGSGRAIRARGGGCMSWGALLGLDLGGTDTPFDGSSFGLLRFWARAEPETVAELTVSLLDPLHFNAPIDMTSSWREYALALDGFAFEDQGPARPLDSSALTHLQFFVFSSESFDFWLDDLTLESSP